MFVTAGVILGLVVATLAILIFAGRDRGTIVPAVNSVARIDSATRSFAVALQVGRDPVGVASGLGAIWVINEADQTIQSIDPTTGEGDPATAVPSGNPSGVAVGEGRLWIASEFGAGFSVGVPQAGGLRISPVHEEWAGISEIALGGGWVWLTYPVRGEVVRLDPATPSQAGEPIIVEGSPTSIVVGGDTPSVWVADELDERVLRIDPETSQYERFDIPGGPVGLAVGAGSVWVTSQRSDTVTRLDSSGHTQVTIPVGDACDGPTAISFGDEGVWIACSLSSAVVRLDPAANEVTDSLSVMGSPTAITRDEDGDVWVTVGRF